MTAQAKLTITGEASQAMGVANKLGNAFKDGAGHVGGIEKGMERANHHILGAIGKMGSLAIAIEAVAAGLEAVQKRAEKTAQGNREAGAGSLTRAQAMARAGITNISDFEENVRQNGGGTTLEQRTESIQAFASASKNTHEVMLPNGRRVTQGGFGNNKFQRYLELASMGVYSNEELIEKLKRGEELPSHAEAIERFRTMSPQARKELEDRDEERRLKVREMEALEGPGRATRLGEARRGMREAENPVSTGLQETVKGTFGKVPLLGPLINSGIDNTQNMIDEAPYQNRQDGFFTPTWQREGSAWKIERQLNSIAGTNKKMSQDSVYYGASGEGDNR